MLERMFIPGIVIKFVVVRVVVLLLVKLIVFRLFVPGGKNLADLFMLKAKGIRERIFATA